MNTHETEELSSDMLESVSGGTTDPRDLDMILADYHAKNPGGKVEDLLGVIEK